MNLVAVIKVVIIYVVLLGFSMATLALAEPALLSGQAVITKADGTVAYQTTEQKEWLPATVGMVLMEGAIVRAGSNASVDLAFTTESVVRLTENTELRIEKISHRMNGLPDGKKKSLHQVRLFLGKGILFVHLWPQPPQSSFVVATGCGVTEAADQARTDHKSETKFIVGLKNSLSGQPQHFSRALQNTIGCRSHDASEYRLFSEKDAEILLLEHLVAVQDSPNDHLKVRFQTFDKDNSQPPILTVKPIKPKQGPQIGPITL